jgi:outer membrane protein TolC
VNAVRTGAAFVFVTLVGVGAVRAGAVGAGAVGVGAVAEVSVAGEQPAVGAAATRLRLESAVDTALENYPAVRDSLSQAAAAGEGVDLARTAYLPSADLLWQSNHATRNKVGGLLFPQSVVPPVSGPTSAEATDQMVWGSAAGLLVSWAPFDFGYRAANVSAATAVQSRATAELTLTRLDVAAAAGGGFLTLAAAQQRVRVANADVERRQVFDDTVRSLVHNQLRAEADSSRADAELAAARIQLIQSREFEAASRSDLIRLMGTTKVPDEIDDVPLLGVVPAVSLSAAPPPDHPAAQAAGAALTETRAREKALDRSRYPRFNLETGVSGRGSGANADGTLDTSTDGLNLEAYNWGVGVTMTFSLMDLRSLHFKERIEKENEASREARYDQTLQALSDQSTKARVAYESALQIVQNTPVELDAARSAEAQARARYQAGLASMFEVADAQRLLAEAEMEDAVARLTVWRALLSWCVAQGDLRPFLDAARSAGPA